MATIDEKRIVELEVRADTFVTDLDLEVLKNQVLIMKYEKSLEIKDFKIWIFSSLTALILSAGVLVLRFYFL